MVQFKEKKEEKNGRHGRKTKQPVSRIERRGATSNRNTHATTTATAAADEDKRKFASFFLVISLTKRP